MNQKSLNDLQFHRVKEAAAGFSQTEPGHAAVLALPSLPDSEACWREMTLVDEASSILGMEDAPTMDGVEDVSAMVDSARRAGVLTGVELVACARLLRAGHEAVQRTRALELRAPGLAEELTDVPDLGAVAERIESTFDKDQRIRDDASPRLGELRSQAKTLGRRVKARIEKMLADKDTRKVLQDDYYTLREGRYVLPVKSEERRFVPGIIHGSSQTAQTVYIEPESIVHDNNQLKVVLDQVEVEEYAILTDRSSLLGRNADGCDVVAGALWRLDSILARARLAGEMAASLPAGVGPDVPLHLVETRNPVLLILGRDVMPVTVEMPLGKGGAALVVSGPNAGGKSVTLSTVGLCVLMARYGFLPPLAPESTIPWFDQIFTVVGDPTNMDQSVSTFTGQLKRVREVLDRGRGRALALLDELATGTEPRQGEALALAIVKSLVQNGVECAVATHFGMLKRAGDEDRRFMNASVGHDPETGLPNYRLEMGQSGDSNPFEVAAAAGLPDDVIETARSLMGEKERKLGEAIAQTEALKAQLSRENTENDEVRKKLTEDKRKYESELKRLRKNSDQLVYDARKEVLQKMKRLEEELEEIGKKAREEERERRRIAVTKKEVRKRKVQVQEDMEKEAPLVEDIPADPFPAADLAPGVVVFVMPLRTEAKVVRVNPDGKRVDVQVGLLKSKVKVGDLRMPRKGKTPAKKKKKAPTPAVSTPPPDLVPTERQDPPDQTFIRTPDNTIDVRGERVDDALSMVDKWLDEAYLREIPEVMIIHGMGTSALRKAVAEYLNTSRYCQTFRAGEGFEGGHGVTLVTVRY